MNNNLLYARRGATSSPSERIQLSDGASCTKSDPNKIFQDAEIQESQIRISSYSTDQVHLLVPFTASTVPSLNSLKSDEILENMKNCSIPEQRKMYIQLVQQKKEQFLLAFEEQKKVLAEDEKLLPKLHYLEDILYIKTTVYIGKFKNVLYDTTQKFTDIFKKFKEESARISEYLDNKDKLSEIIVGETFYEPPTEYQWLPAYLQ